MLARDGSGLRGKKPPLGDQEGEGGHADGDVVVEAPPPPALEMAEADLLLQVLVIFGGKHRVTVPVCRFGCEAFFS